MNEALKDKIVKQLDALSDEQGRQLLDYVGFLESKFHRGRRPASPFERVAETIEETLGAGHLAEAAARGTAELIETAGRVMAGLAAAARAAAEELGKKKAGEPGGAAAAEEGQEREEGEGTGPGA